MDNNLQDSIFSLKDQLMPIGASNLEPIGASKLEPKFSEIKGNHNAMKGINSSAADNIGENSNTSTRPLPQSQPLPQPQNKNLPISCLDLNEPRVNGNPNQSRVEAELESYI